MRFNPYIAFKDNAREAMEFYQSVFGGKLDVRTFRDFGADQDPANANKVMHATLETDGGLMLMASDTPSSMRYQEGSRISLSLSGDDETELRGYWEKLSGDGGSVTMPLDKVQWGDYFGMCTDKFGVNWMVDISAPNTAAAD